MASWPPNSGVAATKARGSCMDTSQPDTVQDAETTIHIRPRPHRLNASSEVEGTSGGKPEGTCGKLPGRPLDQCLSTAGTRPGTGTWHQSYRAARVSPGICHFSFLSKFS